MKIAFFDSGIGGLTVLHEAMQRLPHEQFIYYADTDNVPYGTKSKKEIKKLTQEAVDFLANKNIKALVVACNTATSVAIKTIRKQYDFPIIGMEPAVKPAVEYQSGNKKTKKILVCATKLTLKQKKLKDLITDLNASDRIELLSLQKLVKYAEEAEFDSIKVKRYLKRKLENYNWYAYGSIVLGCTHFIYYTDLIAALVPSHIRIIDGNTGTVKRLIKLLPKDTMSSAGGGTQREEVDKQKVIYYRSGKKHKKQAFQIYLDRC